jgi:conjugative transposon TraK protein
MTFKSLQNIETSFRMTRLVAIIAVTASAVFSLYVWISSLSAIQKEREEIYVLDNDGKALALALSQDPTQNMPVEARHHVKLFHELFFTLSPEPDAINLNIKRALFLSDESAYNQYKDLQESGYYRRLIGNNISQRVVVDSIRVNFENYPYNVTCFATQIITRASNQTRRTLITTCELTREVRSDNNAHGFKINNFIVKKNVDIESQKRHTTF